MKPDVLVGVTTNAAIAVKEAAGTVPVVFMGVTDPVSAGLVASLANPGGNVDRRNQHGRHPHRQAARISQGALPGVTRVAVLWDPKAPGSVPQWEESKEHAKALGLTLYSMEVSSNEQYEDGIRAGGRRAEQCGVGDAQSSRQLEPAAHRRACGKARLPSVCARGDYAENGCLMSYGPGYSLEGRDGARYVDKILKGGKPANLPVEQPTKFELIVNQRTAQAPRRDPAAGNPDADRPRRRVIPRGPGDVSADGVRLQGSCDGEGLVSASGRPTGGFDPRADVNADGVVDIKDWTYIKQLVSVAKCSLIRGNPNKTSPLPPPRSRGGERHCRPDFSADQLIHRDDRQHHRQHEHQHDRAHRDDQRRLQQRLLPR